MSQYAQIFKEKGRVLRNHLKTITPKTSSKESAPLQAAKERTKPINKHSNNHQKHHDTKESESNHRKTTNNLAKPVVPPQIPITNFIGEPNLDEYLGLRKDNTHTSQTYFRGRKLHLLSRVHLPESVRLFEANLQASKQVEVTEASLFPKRSKQSDLLIKTSKGTRSIRPETGLVLAIQTVVFVRLNAKQFQQIFNSELQYLENKYFPSSSTEGKDQAVLVVHKSGQQSQDSSRLVCPSTIPVTEGIQMNESSTAEVGANNMVSVQSGNGQSMNEQLSVLEITAGQPSQVPPNAEQSGQIQIMEVDESAQDPLIVTLVDENEPQLDETQLASLLQEYAVQQAAAGFDPNQPYPRFYPNPSNPTNQESSNIPSPQLCTQYNDNSNNVLASKMESASMIPKDQHMSLDHQGNTSNSGVAKETIQQSRLPTYLKIMIQLLPEGFVIWPALVLQPINLDRAEAIQFTKDRQIKSATDSRQLLERVANTVQNSNHTAKQFSQLTNLTGHPCLPSYMQFIGTEKYSIVEDGVIEWKDVNQNQLRQIWRQPLLQGIELQLNPYIKMLNEFRFNLEQAQIKPEDSRFFLNRIAKYKTSNGTLNLCLLLRMDNSKNARRVLLLDLERDLSSNKLQLLWANCGAVTVNYTLPPCTTAVGWLFYLFDRADQSRYLLRRLFTDFFHEQTDFSDLFRNNVTEMVEKFRLCAQFPSERCLECHYPPSNLSAQCCFFCSRFCHNECVKPSRMNYSEIIPQDSKSQWACGDCQPCEVCFRAVDRNSVVCIRCKAKYHEVCGKIKGVTAAAAEKYECEQCLKCRMCQKKLKNKQYSLYEEDLFCEGCYQLILKKNYCLICMANTTQGGLWFQCSNMKCAKWLHKACDPFLDNRQANEVGVYWCPLCRKTERRRIILKTIDLLKIFDQFQYFTDPDYENLIDYRDIISEPMCLLKMKEKCIEGSYDADPLTTLRADFQKIISNALTYNMPKDDPHFQARLLKVMGGLALDTVAEALNCPDADLTECAVYKHFKIKEKQLFRHIYDSYPEIILNYGFVKSRIEVVRRRNAPPAPSIDPFFFSSKYILHNFFKNSSLRLRIKKEPYKIHHLFETAKLQPGFWLPIHGNICYYHPYSNSPLIFQCPACNESYCCTKECFRHRVCKCGQVGCACDRSSCRCPLIKDSERKSMELKIMALGLGVNKREVTLNFTRCLKCGLDDLHRRRCYICAQYCFVSSEECLKCRRLYHPNCEERKAAQQFLAIFGNNPELTDLLGLCPDPNGRNSRFNRRPWQSRMITRLPKMCMSCCLLPENQINMYNFAYSNLRNQIQSWGKINFYLPCFMEILNTAGVRAQQHQIIELVHSNFDQFLKYENLFEEFRSNANEILSERQNAQLKHEAAHRQLFEPLSSSFRCSQQIEAILQDDSIESHFKPLFQETQTLMPTNFVEIRKDSFSIFNPTTKPNIVFKQSLERVRQLVIVKSSHGPSKTSQNSFQVFSKIPQSSIAWLDLITLRPPSSLSVSQGSVSSLFQVSTRTQVRLRSMWLYQTLSSFLMKLVEESKIVLRKGTTCILHDEPYVWKVLKRLSEQNHVIIELVKKYEAWILMIDGVSTLVHSIADIQERLKHLANLATFEQLAAFLGFNLSDHNFYKANHFTNFLQTHPLENLPREERKRKIMELYDEMSVEPNGIYTCLSNDPQDGRPRRFEYNVTRKPIYYLQKRNKNGVKPPEKKNSPYISFEDLKRDLSDSLPISLPSSNSHRSQLKLSMTSALGQVFIAPSKIHKLGLFAKQDMKKHTIVVEYIGEIICDAVADMREKQSTFNSCCYMFGLNRRNIDRKQVIDATYKGNMARYLNHSCDVRIIMEGCYSGSQSHIIK